MVGILAYVPSAIRYTHGMVLTVRELRQLASALGASVHWKFRKAAIIRALRNQLPQMATAVELRTTNWQTASLFVRFLSEVYRTSPEDAANELATLAQLARANTTVAHMAYHVLPKVNHPEIQRAHERRFREFSHWQRLNALRALVKLRGRESISLLQEALHDPFEPIQRVALAHLTRWQPESLREVAHKLLTQRRGLLRSDALKVFVNLPIEQSMIPLFAASFDRKPGIRNTAQVRLNSLRDAGDPFLSACAQASTWNYMHIHSIIPVFIAQTPRHELPQLEELFDMLAKNGPKKARRILAHAMHNQLLFQRGALLGLIQQRPTPAPQGPDVRITTAVTHSSTSE